MVINTKEIINQLRYQTGIYEYNMIDYEIKIVFMLHCRTFMFNN